MKRLARYCMYLLPAAAAAQPADLPADAHGWLRIEAPPVGATLMLGDSTLGDAGLVHPAPAGRHTVRLTAGDGGEWNPRMATAEVDVPAADTAVVALRLPVRYRVTTVPSGARVALEGAGGVRESLGLAPLVVDRPQPLSGLLVATRPGYAEARAAPGDSAVNRLTLVLVPLTPEEGAAVDWRPPRRSRTWIDVAAAGLALAGAAVAVHYKFQADAVDDRYRSPGSPERGDPDLRVEAQRLDRISAGGLGAMQLGLGILAIRLVLR